MYRERAMNQNSSTNPSTSAAQHGLTAEAISRRAYELWEQEGRPENRDLEHWLRAEQDLLAQQQKSTNSAGTSAPSDRPSNSDAQPLQGTRAAAAANREPKAEAKPAAKRTPTAQPPAGTKPPAARSTQPGMRTDPARAGRV